MSNIKVFIEADDGLPRLFVTRGVEAIEGRLVDGMPYRSGAIVPRGPWRAVSPEEEAVLRVGADAPDCRRRDRTISIVRVPHAVIEPLAARGCDRASSVSEYAQLTRQPEWFEALRSAVQSLYPFVESPEGLFFCGVCIQRGGLRTTTTHDDEGIVTWSGLHIDAWDAGSFAEAHESRNQMSVNLGREERYLMFIPRPLAELAEAAGPVDFREGYVGLGSAFMSRFPEHPIYKIRVRPNEAYLAPTDNIVHDGTTEDSTSPDVTLNVRGVFRTYPDNERDWES